MSGMAAEREQSSQKLVYLRDHANKPRSRTLRTTRRGSSPPPAEMAAEGTWLARSLIIVAGALVFYWLGVLGGAMQPETEEAWRWTSSHAMPQLFLAAGAAFAARSISRGETRSGLLVGLVAGGLIVLALGGIGRALVGEGLGDLSLSVRTDVLLQTATLAIGVWAASFAMRSERHQAS